jgi:hypothetical protein
MSEKFKVVRPSGRKLVADHRLAVNHAGLTPR